MMLLWSRIFPHTSSAYAVVINAAAASAYTECIGAITAAAGVYFTSEHEQVYLSENVLGLPVPQKSGRTMRLRFNTEKERPTKAARRPLQIHHRRGIEMHNNPSNERSNNCSWLAPSTRD